VEWIATSDSSDGQPGTTECAVSPDGLNAVLRTRWLESAHLQLAHRPEYDLVRLDADDENLLH
jgi:hypothetical protein